VQRREPRQPAAAAAAAAGDVSLIPESQMKLELAWASDVTPPPHIAGGRSSFRRSVAAAKPELRSKMKQVATATLSGAALQSNDIDGTVALPARGRMEIATKELTGAKRTISAAEAAAEAEAAVARE
jgi:hypothetical protein